MKICSVQDHVPVITYDRYCYLLSKLKSFDNVYSDIHYFYNLWSDIHYLDNLWLDTLYKRFVVRYTHSIRLDIHARIRQDILRM